MNNRRSKATFGEDCSAHVNEDSSVFERFSEFYSFIQQSRRVLWFAAIWFGVFLAPPLASLHLFYPLQYVQERYLYLPSIGFCLAVALAIEWLSSRKQLGVPARAIALAVTAALIIVWSTILISQN